MLYDINDNFDHGEIDDDHEVNPLLGIKQNTLDVNKDYPNHIFNFVHQFSSQK